MTPEAEAALLKAENAKLAKRCQRLEHLVLNGGIDDDRMIQIEDCHDTWDLAGYHYVCGCPCQCPTCLVQDVSTRSSTG